MAGDGWALARRSRAPVLAYPVAPHRPSCAQTAVEKPGHDHVPRHSVWSRESCRIAHRVAVGNRTCAAIQETPLMRLIRAGRRTAIVGVTLFDLGIIMD